MKFFNRTDLAYETAERISPNNGVSIEKSVIFNIPVTKVVLDEKGGEKIGKPAGEYITLFCEDKSEKEEVEALFSVMSELVPPKGKVLVVGLGNEDITPDALGVRTISGVLATAHFSEQEEFGELGMRKVYVVETGVMAQTGLESAEQIKYISDGISPDYIIAIDSLACGELSRLGKTIQITDSGIAPGSGVKNSRTEISYKSLGVPVFAIGVPTIIDLKSIIKSKDDEISGMVMMRDVDVTVNHYARVISKALNRALNPLLSQDEIDGLLI